MSEVKIEIALPSQKTAILNFLMNYFRVDEPMARAAEMNESDTRDWFESWVINSLKKPVSFVAMNEKREIVACRLNEMTDLNSTNDSQDQPENFDTSDHPLSVRKIWNFLELLTKDSEQLLAPETKRVLNFLIVSVHPDYQRRGIALKLIQSSIQLAIEQECDYVCTVATALRSQELFEKKFGFQTLRIIEHKDYCDPITKKQYFNCDDGTMCGKFMAKKLH